MNTREIDLLKRAKELVGNPRSNTVDEMNWLRDCESLLSSLPTQVTVKSAEAKVVTAKSDCPDVLTPGKEYAVTQTQENCFRIRNDDGYFDYFHSDYFEPLPPNNEAMAPQSQGAVDHLPDVGKVIDHIADTGKLVQSEVDNGDFKTVIEERLWHMRTIGKDAAVAECEYLLSEYLKSSPGKATQSGEAK